MVSLWWGQSALLEQIEAATSELLPANQEDIALHFLISDQIRSKKVNAKDAMRALKRRMEHKNPNVQITTLSLTDTCVKNAGDQFVREIASREFMEILTGILHAPDCNLDVKNKILSVVQTWALAAKNNPNLSFLTDTYHLLQYEHFQFPPVKEHVNAILLETAAPPEWTDSDVCERCRTPFTFTNPPLQELWWDILPRLLIKLIGAPHLAIDETVRVCHACYIKLKTARISKKDGGHSHQNLPGTSSAQSIQTLGHAPAASVVADPSSLKHQNEIDEDQQFAEDLKKAIELSRKEADQNQSLAPSASTEDAKPAQGLQYEKHVAANGEDGDDPDMAAAIAASLRDMEDAQKTELEYYNVHRPALKASKDELTAVEMENIELFATLMARINGTEDKIAYDDQVNQLYIQLGTLQPKLINNLNDASQKHKKFADLHEKLINAVRTYDRLFEERVASSHQRVASASPFHDASRSMPYQNTVMNRAYPAPSVVGYPPFPQRTSFAEQQLVTAPPQYRNMQPPVSTAIINPTAYLYPAPSAYPAANLTSGAQPTPAVAYNNAKEQQQQSNPSQAQFGEQTIHHPYVGSVNQWQPQSRQPQSQQQRQQQQQQQSEPAYSMVSAHDSQHQKERSAVVDDTPLIEL